MARDLAWSPVAGKRVSGTLPYKQTADGMRTYAEMTARNVEWPVSSEVPRLHCFAEATYFTFLRERLGGFVLPVRAVQIQRFHNPAWTIANKRDEFQASVYCNERVTLQNDVRIREQAYF